MKKFLIILFLLVPFMAHAYDIEIGGIYYFLDSKNKTAEVANSIYKSYSGSVTIPDKITSDNVEYSVTSIRNSAFSDCQNLTSINIPTSVTHIGDRAFYNCSGLTDITIPNSVISIGEFSFYNCTGLVSISIPPSVTYIELSAFLGCTHIKELIYADGCTTALSTGLTSIEEVRIPNSVTRIGSYAFLECENLTSITIPNSVAYIEESAFSLCSGLTSITIPSSVVDIHEYAFEECTNIKELIYAEGCTIALPTGLTSIEKVTIPESVTSIGDDAFYNCSELTSVTIPKSVTSIGDNAFRECSKLTAVNITDLEAWNKISFGNYWSNPLFYAHLLYLNGDEVKDLIIPNTAIGIMNYAFCGCSGLTSVTIPKSITAIGNNAFYGCSNIRDIYSKNPVPPTCGTNVFYNVKTANCRLHISVGTKEDYAFAEGWGNFSNILDDINEGEEVSETEVEKLQKEVEALQKEVEALKAENDALNQRLEMGDIDGSGSVTVTDVVKVVQSALKQGTAK